MPGLHKQIKYFVPAVVAGLLSLYGLINYVSASPHIENIKGEEGWAIRQSSNFAGTVFSDLTPHALKMHIGRLGLTIITKAPKWNALVFNENAKTYADLPYKRWQQRFSISLKSNYRDSQGQLALIAKDTGKTMTIDHYRAFECWVLKKGEPQKHIAEEKISQLWIATDIKAPSQIAQIFCSHLGMPVKKGIPLKASHNNNGKMVSVLETLSVERRRMPPATFAPLPGYRKVKDELELVMGESTDEVMGDLLDLPPDKIKSNKAK